jgi:hypothetical protein
MVTGRPRYCIGVVNTEQPRRAAMVGIKSFGTAMGRNPLLLRLICKPDTSTKVLSMAAISLMFVACAGVIIAVSSANCSRVVGAVGMSIRSGWSFWNMVWRESTARLKSRGDSGSP